MPQWTRRRKAQKYTHLVEVTASQRAGPSRMDVDSAGKSVPASLKFVLRA